MVRHQFPVLGRQQKTVRAVRIKNPVSDVIKMFYTVLYGKLLTNSITSTDKSLRTEFVIVARHHFSVLGRQQKSVRSVCPMSQTQICPQHSEIKYRKYAFVNMYIAIPLTIAI